MIRIPKTIRSNELIEYFDDKTLMFSLMFPILLPTVLIILLAIFYNSYSALLAIPLYIFLPTIVGKKQFILVALSALGLMAVSTGQNPLLISVLLPAIFIRVGIMFYQKVCEFKLVRRFYSSIENALQLEALNFINLNDSKGPITISQYLGEKNE